MSDADEARDTFDDRIEELREKLHDMFDAARSEQADELLDTAAERDHLAAELETAHAAIVKREQRIADLEQQLEQLRDVFTLRVKQLEHELADARAALGKREEAVAPKHPWPWPGSDGNPDKPALDTPESTADHAAKHGRRKLF